MKIAVISDIHANLEALEACLAKIEELKPDKLICLGDIVDYCAQPNECIELVKNNADVVLLGNHDEAQLDYEIADGFSENAFISSVHTRSVIKPGYIEYFKTLPRSYSLDDLLFVHASPDALPSYRYVLTPEAAQDNFASFEEKVCFIGHSHRPVIFEQRGSNVFETESVNIDGKYRYIINVGSVGQPRDGNPHLSFGFFDNESFKYINYRVFYPSESASKKIIMEGLPLFLAERILKGV
jgi:predicted phosphodiesterase